MIDSQTDYQDDYGSPMLYLDKRRKQLLKRCAVSVFIIACVVTLAFIVCMLLWNEHEEAAGKVGGFSLLVAAVYLWRIARCAWVALWGPDEAVEALLPQETRQMTTNDDAEGRAVMAAKDSK